MMPKALLPLVALALTICDMASCAGIKRRSEDDPADEDPAPKTFKGKWNKGGDLDLDCLCPSVDEGPLKGAPQDASTQDVERIWVPTCPIDSEVAEGRCLCAPLPPGESSCPEPGSDDPADEDGSGFGGKTKVPKKTNNYEGSWKGGPGGMCICPYLDMDHELGSSYTCVIEAELAEGRCICAPSPYGSSGCIEPGEPPRECLQAGCLPCGSGTTAKDGECVPISMSHADQQLGQRLDRIEEANRELKQMLEALVSASQFPSQCRGTRPAK
jgi:hypothetical protein